MGGGWLFVWLSIDELFYSLKVGFQSIIDIPYGLGKIPRIFLDPPGRR